MAFELKDGRLTFTNEDAIAAREKYRSDVTVQAEMLNATGGDREWASAILNGPSEEQVAALKEKHEADPEVVPAFDRVYGAGAAQYYIENKTWGEYAKDIALGVPGGIQSALGETILWLEGFSLVTAAQSGWTPTEGAKYLREQAADPGFFSKLTGSWDTGEPITDEEKARASEVFLGKVRETARMWSPERRQKELASAESRLRYLQNREDAGDAVEDLEGQREGVRLLMEGILSAGEASKDERDLYARKVATEMMLNDPVLFGGFYRALPEETQKAVVEAATVDLQKTLPGQLVAGVTQFVSGFAIPGGALTKLATVAKGGTIAKGIAGLVAGMITDATAFNPDDPQFIDLVETTLGADLSDTFLDYIRKDGDDTEAEKRLKAALDGAVPGVLAEALFMAAAKGMRRLRKGDVKPGANPVAEEVDKIKTAETAGPLSPEQLAEAAKAVEEGFGRTVQAEARAVEEGTIAAEKGATEAAPEVSPIAPHGTPQVSQSDTAIAALSENPGKRPPIKKWVQAADIKAKELLGDVVDYVSSTARDVWEKASARYSEFRTFEQMREAVRVPARALYEAARGGNVSEIVDYMAKAPSIYEAKVRQFALMTVSDRMREGVQALADHIAKLDAAGGFDANYREALVARFDQMVHAWAHLDAVNRWVGSEIGAQLGQRNTIGEARATGRLASPKELKAATEEGAKSADAKKQEADFLQIVAEAEERTKVAVKEANHFWSEYERLRKIRPDAAPEIFKWLMDEMDASRREGLRFGERPKAPVLDERTRLNKAVDGINEYLYSAMLSGPRTIEVNAVGGLLNIARHMFSQGLYAAITRDPKIRRAFLARTVGLWQAVPGAVRSSIKAMKEGQSFISETHTFVEGGRHAIPNKGLGRIVRAPLSLMAAQDQFLKYLWYKGEVTAKAAMEADVVGLKGQARAGYIADAVSRSLDPHGRGIDLVAAAQAEEIPFQKRFSRSSPYAVERAVAGVVDAVSNAKNPFLRLGGNIVFPFSRIMFRLMDEGIRLTPVVREAYAVAHHVGTGGKASSKWGDDFLGRNGKFQQARAVGEFASGMALSAWTFSLAQQGMITGGEPVEYVDAAMQRQTVQPYSIRIGDKWYDYSRYEPFAFPMKLMANAVMRSEQIIAANDRMELETAGDRMSALMASVGFLFAEMFTNNSFTEGIEQLLGMAVDQDQQATERLLKGQAEKVVPNILKKINEAANGTLQYRGNSPFEAIERHFTSILGSSLGLDVARDPFLGEPVRKPNPAQAWTGFVGTKQERLEDPVFEMLLEMNRATGKDFTLKAPWDFSGIRSDTDLRKVRTDDGSRSLYDFYLSAVSSTKVNGKTYREALHELAVNDTYRKQTWGNRWVPDNQKVKYIEKVKRTYEDAALAQLETQKSFQRLMEGQAARDYFNVAR